MDSLGGHKYNNMEECGGGQLNTLENPFMNLNKGEYINKVEQHVYIGGDDFIN